MSERHRPTNLKQLGSFLGADNQFIKFTPSLATISFPFRSISKRDAEWNWNDNHEGVFLKMIEEIQNIVYLSQFNRNKEI